MGRDTSRTFKYIKMRGSGRGFFCVQQNALIFWWLLYCKQASLASIFSPWMNLPVSGLNLGSCRERCRLFLSNLKTFVAFLMCRWDLRPIDSAVELPLYGQLCIPVHKGYKVFDLRKGIVFKVFDSDVNTSSVLTEIEGLKKVSPIDFAPSVKRWNVEERWYEEEYVESTSHESSLGQLDSELFLEKFRQDIMPLLDYLILWHNPIMNNSIEYGEEISEFFKDSGISKSQSKERGYHDIRMFFDSVMRRLRLEANCNVQLVFTHGDFCPANMLNTKNGIRVIDWEGAKYRSALFDFYHYFFYRAVSKKMSITQVASEVNEALPMLIASLARKSLSLSRSLDQLANIYRLTYYNEEILQLVEREMTDNNLKISEIILKYIETFNRYENVLVMGVEEGAREFIGWGEEIR